MIGAPLTLLVCFSLLAVLLLMLRGVSAARSNSELDYPALDNSKDLSCPTEFIARVFSPDDSRYVLAANSPELARLFQRERKQVALVWVRQTSAAIQHTMRQHKQAARISPDLDPATELKLLLLYSELMLLCGVLFVAVSSLGPLGLHRLALCAQVHSQRLAQVQQSFQAATTPRELPRAGAA